MCLCVCVRERERELETVVEGQNKKKVGNIERLKIRGTKKKKERVNLFSKSMRGLKVC